MPYSLFPPPSLISTNTLNINWMDPTSQQLGIPSSLWFCWHGQWKFSMSACISLAEWKRKRFYAYSAFRISSVKVVILKRFGDNSSFLPNHSKIHAEVTLCHSLKMRCFPTTTAAATTISSSLFSFSSHFLLFILLEIILGDKWDAKNHNINWCSGNTELENY